MTTLGTERLQLGVSLQTLDPEQRLGTMELLNGSCVKSVELWEPKIEKSEGYVNEMCRLLDAAGVEARTIHANFGASLDISSPDGAVRSAGIEAFGAALDLATRTGVRIIVMHPSSEPISDEVRAARMERAKRSVRTIADMADNAGCRIALELLPRTCLGHSVEELWTLMEDVDANRVGVCLDTNHLMADFALLPDVVRSLGPRLFALHCSDYDGIDERHWPPLQGVIDWPAFLEALREVHFSGPLNYEAKLEGRTPAERLAFLEANYARLVSGDGPL
jgi:sugar phosphate isomerase/epimerase